MINDIIGGASAGFISVMIYFFFRWLYIKIIRGEKR